MVYGIGIDMVEVARMEKSLARPGFAAFCFSAQEQAALAGRPASSAAACFAAKEALGKALGTGVYPGQLPHISLLHHPSGQPFLCCTGPVAQQLEDLGLAAHVSVSHDGGFAVCVVLLEKG